MAQTVINFNTDAKLKSEAKQVLDEMGLNFSIALNAYLRRLIIEKRIEFTVPEIPNARLRKAIKDAEQEYKDGKLKFYTDIKEMRKSLGV
ncbi:MAG: RelB/DinJ family addiction module antitoxin [Parcubacteria group bacterium GW2011_GWB1_35_5]|nr:MAG: RelB/DinJ family addiction module antitoxin [Parcubacteria group bacterium GW2011_GWC1_34_10]KKP81402.1 MAG: RelB/DinJ family addiction module antitoxin [Parcubacteria group bacterium GW2011_GWB1_35_5]